MHRHRFNPVAAVILAWPLAAIASGEAPVPPNAPRLNTPSVVARSVDLGQSDPTRILDVAVSLPYGDPVGMQAFVDDVSNPAGPNYLKFLTPDEVGARFGLPQDSVQSVVDFLKESGFKINLVGRNRLSILAEGTVAQAESAFSTTIHEFQTVRADEPGNPRYFSYTSDLKVPTAIAPYVIDVTGLESFTRPQFRALSPTQTRTLYDLAPLYSALRQGQGRTVAISNFDGFRLTNVPLYYTQYGLPAPPGGVGSNVTVVAISGGAGSGGAGGEGDLDIQMVLGMAPLCTFRIYDGGSSNYIGVLTTEANENLADIISESYGWNLSAGTALSAHNLRLSMSAQGITYMAASGDSGTTLEPFSYPDYDPEVLMVGGTVASVDGSGARTGEVAWALSGGQGGGGGWSTNTSAFNVLPSWQQGTNVPTTINHRLVPDVALNAGGGGAYFFYLNGALTSGFVGTSFASPVFAGSLAVVEQELIARGGMPPDGAGKQRFGRIQDLIYSQNGRPDVWFDVTSGSIGTLPNGSQATAGPAWDFATGWGAIDWNAFATSQFCLTDAQCDDRNVCTNDSCSAGTCLHAANANPCDDGDPCKTDDFCSGGICRPGPGTLNCDDGNFCTDDSCIPFTGCHHGGNSLPCSDGNACTANDTCVHGACVPGPPLDCNDGNACTTESCNPATGCVFTNNTNACDDGNACTSNDACAGGSCQGTTIVCNDGNPCTTDSCNPASGCVFTGNTNACDDGNPCTAGDVCGPRFAENFDAMTAPVLPAGWASSVVGSGAPWVTHNASSESTPNSAFGVDSGAIADEIFDSPPIAISSAAATLTFRNRWSFDDAGDCFDAGVLEIKLGAAPFSDIVDAGGSFVTGGYTGTVNQDYGNPLANRAAWCFTSPGYPAYLTTTLNLPSAAAGQTIRLRWRLGSDSSASTVGQDIDSIVLNDPMNTCQSGPAIDCSDNDPCTVDSCSPATGCAHTVITAPPEVQNVSVATDKTTYSWSTAANATVYDVVRGGIAALPVGPGGGDEVCFDNLHDTTLTDPAVPTPGAGFWYLSRGENACGMGTYGIQSNQLTRTTATCP
jgi:Pro-kumamolisin, activation domain/Subtilase family/Dictyostelium (slime mold) repeat